MNALRMPSTPSRLNKVPEVTLVFWIVKMMSTTVGETAADFLNVSLNLGLTGTSLAIGLLFAVVLYFQLRAMRYVPSLYWLTVVLISVLGTLITDNLTDHFGVPLAVSTGLFSITLIAIFGTWYAREKTLSIHAVNTLKRELFYWTAILATFALGTAAGDWLAEGLSLGYANAALLFGGLVAASALAYYVLKANAVACFWIAYVLTRPFGAAFGDLLSQPTSNGGLGLGTTGTSVIFMIAILGFVVFMTAMQRSSKRSKF